MNVYDELRDCIESAWSRDSCEYEVYSEMFDLIADAEYKYDDLRAENVKLRELVRKYSEYTDQDRCEGCFCKSRCNDGDVDECWQLTEIQELARKLGIEGE